MATLIYAALGGHLTGFNIPNRTVIQPRFSLFSQRRISKINSSYPHKSIMCSADSDDPLQPSYSMVSKKNGYEARLYNNYMYVNTEYQTRPAGIAELAAFLEGENSLEVKIPATQPCVTQYEPQNSEGPSTTLLKEMRLYVPSIEGMSSLPLPTASEVRLGVSTAELVAVLPFSGNITPDTAEEAKNKLTNLLKEDGVELYGKDAEGTFRIAQYGQLYSLSRKNECWLRIDPKDIEKLTGGS